ncbi:PorV/PorQ family protein [candidate division KSB1 bacterium]|nr:PorV/PorQ family protein [candidate division KSB1 bacterium]
MFQKTRLILLCLIISVSAFDAKAQLIPILGGQRTGTAMFQFLKIGVGGRAVGMGESFVAVANDASALYWNPAGIVQIGKNELIFSHVNWPVDIKHEFIGYVQKLGNVTAIGISVNTLHTDDFEETTEYQPRGTGRFVSFGDIAIGVTIARKMTDRFSAGLTVKYIDETLDDIHLRSVLIDFGTYYWTGFGSSRFAVSVVNFGANSEPKGSVVFRDGSEVDQFQDFSPPTIFRIGFATELVDNEVNKVTSSIQLNHPNDNSENLNLGLEYWWNNTLALRGGYRANVVEESFTFGAGINLPLKPVHLKADISYSSFGRLGNATRLSMNFQF